MNIPSHIPAPSKFWLAVEPRAVIESLSVIFNQQHLKDLPQGNGAPVMVLPGLGTTDVTTIPLRKFLKGIGYNPYGWGLGLNRGFKPEYEVKLLKRLRRIYLKYDQPIRLIGWSMGGIYAREIAKIDSRVINQVITMGSPFSGGKTQKTNAATIYRILNGQRIDATHDSRALHLHEAPPVPTTAIYSKTDGVVNWQYCIEYDDVDHIESIEVKGSHLGFGINSMVWMILADRLAQDPDNWHSFDNAKLKQVEHALLV
ncbi:MAG: hypothetical protein R2730_12890 [Chitinophagales bacterium]